MASGTMNGCKGNQDFGCGVTCNKKAEQTNGGIATCMGRLAWIHLKRIRFHIPLVILVAVLSLSLGNMAAIALGKRSPQIRLVVLREDAWGAADAHDNSRIIGAGSGKDPENGAGPDGNPGSYAERYVEALRGLRGIQVDVIGTGEQGAPAVIDPKGEAGQEAGLGTGQPPGLGTWAAIFADHSVSGAVVILGSFEDYVRNGTGRAVEFHPAPGVARSEEVEEYLAAELLRLRAEAMLVQALEEAGVDGAGADAPAGTATPAGYGDSLGQAEPSEMQDGDANGLWPGGAGPVGDSEAEGEPEESDTDDAFGLSVEYEGPEWEPAPFLAPPAYGIGALFLLLAFLHACVVIPGVDDRQLMVCMGNHRRGTRTHRWPNPVVVDCACAFLPLAALWCCEILLYVGGLRFFYDVEAPAAVVIALLGLCVLALAAGSAVAMAGKRGWAAYMFMGWLILNATLGGGLYGKLGQPWTLIAPITPVAWVLEAAEGQFLPVVWLWAEAALIAGAAVVWAAIQGAAARAAVAGNVPPWRR
jgi:hypothetical protein